MKTNNPLPGLAEYGQAVWLGAYQTRVAERLMQWRQSMFADRLWHKDPTIWSADPAVPEITDRLGWLTLPQAMSERIADLEAFAGEIRGEGIRHAVLLGMGGSSLAPEVFQSIFDNRSGFPELIVLDSTHPGAVLAVDRRIDPERTLFVISSKSGTTTEPLSFFYYFWERVGRQGRRFIAITDPGTPLEQMARKRGFRRIFPAPTDVGGRYSALTVFGLVPAALIGVDIAKLLGSASQMSQACAARVHADDNPGVALGAVLGELALAGRDKVTFVVSPALASLPDWIEQLVAESTGKEDKGIVPVAGEPLGAPENYGSDRVFIELCLKGEENAAVQAKIAALENAGHPTIRFTLFDREELGREFFRWEIATAAAGAVLGIHPFNQPDVQLAKELAKKAMQRVDTGAISSEGLIAADSVEMSPALGKWIRSGRSGDYIALQAYLAPEPAAIRTLESIRLALRDRLRLATTVGFGPRFLHSTGQLHKGGPNTGMFLQLVDDPAVDLTVPESGYTFDMLVRAQAAGDAEALHQRGRRVLRVNLGKDVAGGLHRLQDTLLACC